MNSNNSEHVQNLFKAFVHLDNIEAVDAFLQDICTPREIQDMAQRLQVAKLLANETSYTTIQEQTGASATTIARVSRALQYGPKGYKPVLDFLSEEE